jgi:hypothetical protein
MINPTENLLDTAFKSICSASGILSMMIIRRKLSPTILEEAIRNLREALSSLEKLKTAPGAASK